VRPDAAYVLYWMTAYRRTQSNFSLQRAIEWALHLELPLVVLSALRLDYPFASDRIHSFLLDSMEDVSQDLAPTRAHLFSYVEPTPGAGKGLLAALAAEAALVVTDDAPVFFLPAMTKAAAARTPVLMEGVDHNGLLPLAATDKVFLRAYDLRRFLQRELPPYLLETPDSSPTDNLVELSPDRLEHVYQKWPSALPHRMLVSELALSRSVPATAQRGGQAEANGRLQHFVSKSLARYEERNHPDEEVVSGLSPYLHFGNVSPHQVFEAVANSEGWTPADLADHSTGARSGWWGMSDAAEGFLDQLITWRELGYRSARYVPGNQTFNALPAWARETLANHASDPREYIYSLEQLEAAETHDEIWNRAQAQLRDEGMIHNYLRMLWGKKIIEWTRDPGEAHDIMFELNDKYALDGRDPNSVSGIHWVLGRYDRPWGPERPIFGKVRYMSSDSTRRKLRMTSYMGQSKMLNT
jgi:deoxyribodipyrimidine photo-lyase